MPDERPGIVLDDQKNLPFEVLGTAECEWCDKAQQLIAQQGMTSKKMIIGQDMTMLEFTLATEGATTVPQVFRRGELIGGYEALVRYFERYKTFGDMDV